jgi:hypothetical protein
MMPIDTAIRRSVEARECFDRAVIAEHIFAEIGVRQRYQMQKTAV